MFKMQVKTNKERTVYVTFVDIHALEMERKGTVTLEPKK